MKTFFAQWIKHWHDRKKAAKTKFMVADRLKVLSVQLNDFSSDSDALPALPLFCFRNLKIWKTKTKRRPLVLKGLRYYSQKQLWRTFNWKVFGGLLNSLLPGGDQTHWELFENAINSRLHSLTHKLTTLKYIPWDQNACYFFFYIIIPDFESASHVDLAHLHIFDQTLLTDHRYSPVFAGHKVKVIWLFLQQGLEPVLSFNAIYVVNSQTRCI